MLVLEVKLKSKTEHYALIDAAILQSQINRFA